jgi:D-psicose/D-tagatose/L-ribulose 3-epimerase
MSADLDVACHLNVLVPDATSENLARALSAISAIGYRRVALPPLDPSGIDAAPMRDRFADHGLTPITLAGQTPDADVSSLDPAVSAAGLDALRTTLALTVALGGDQMNGVPYGVFGKAAAPVDEESFVRAAQAVGKIADEANDQGVVMTFEVLNRYETAMVNTAEQAMAFVAASGSDHLRIHLDTFHMAVEEASISDAIRTAMPKLGYLELGQSGRGSLATGVVDIATVVSGARADGYAGRLGLEAFSRPLMAPFVADMLAIWRTPYVDGVDLAEQSFRMIRESVAQAGARP